MKKSSLFFLSTITIVSLVTSGCTPYVEERLRSLTGGTGQTTPAVVVDSSTTPTTPSTTNTTDDTTSVAKQQTSIELVANQTDEGKTALDVLKNSGAQVETKSYGDAGSFITAINGVAGDASNYWSFYVNDQYAQQAADKTEVKQGDRIKFIYEKVDNTLIK